MSTEGGNWTDLRARVLSALVMVVIGAGAIWAGGLALAALGVVVTGLMVWELARMVIPDNNAKHVAAGALGAVFMALAIGPGGLLPFYLLFLAVPGLLAWEGRKLRLWVPLYAYGLQLAVWYLVMLRGADGGFFWIIWIVLVIIASDVMGYFAGRTMGGPKFWPRVSPKKTWSGTVAGWVGAGLIGWGLVVIGGAPPILILLSILTAFAGQIGDIAESAIKRATGIKDSSNLIPGHGGLLDRFDALAGAGLFLFVINSLIAGA
ncbi:phosphatidate cytidylyltransferase [Loktanella sp. IMCC34160]|uniref:phosphatidate cytidylyltransferase n=1 Tax=Loktanella sp. IMCC34160 TaxID=2510646 RepID=UPI00101DD1B4|nr:phosphatidate cytidylyltransferase [Loktanella sp. IMCC34160]RYG92183.1 phosphatidate cytidylyltransferase [Loktanella sp. IMCC34160]